MIHLVTSMGRTSPKWCVFLVLPMFQVHFAQAKTGMAYFARFPHPAWIFSGRPSKTTVPSKSCFLFF